MLRTGKQALEASEMIERGMKRWHGPEDQLLGNALRMLDAAASSKLVSRTQRDQPYPRIAPRIRAA